MPDSLDVQKKLIDSSQDKSLQDDKSSIEKKPFLNSSGRPFINNNPAFNKPGYGGGKFGGGRQGGGRPTIRKHAARSR